MIVVIGIGNEYRKDEAAGLHAARRLKDKIGNYASVLEQSGEATALMEAWGHASRVILIDALQSGRLPGEVRRFEIGEDPLPAKLFRCSTHVFGVAESIELARVIGRLPERLIVYGIEGQSFDLGEGLTPDVGQAVTEVVQRVTNEIASMK